MKVSTIKKSSLYLSSIITLILIIYLVYFLVGNNVIFPSPIEVVKAFLGLFRDLDTYVVIGYTFLRLIIVIGLSFLIGSILGILASKFEGCYLFLKPIMNILRTVPVVAVVVIILMLIGKVVTPYIICFLVLVPLIYENFYAGIKSLDKDLMEVWTLESSFNFKVIKRIIMPLAKPFISASFNQSVGLGLKVLVMAEFICYTPNSIGRKLTLEANYLRYDNVFAWTLFLFIFVLVIESIVKLVFKDRKDG